MRKSNDHETAQSLAVTNLHLLEAYMTNGWIKLHRQLRENPIYTNSTAVHCWIECLLRSQHEGKEVYAKRERVSLQPGQFLMGREEFGRSLGIAPTTAWYWVQQFEADSMLDIRRTVKGCVVSIRNWKNYQGFDSTVDKKRTTDGQQMDTNKNDKNVKNILPKGNGLTTVQVNSSLPQDKRNLKVEFLLQAFTDTYRFPPTDRNPRQVAWNFVQIIQSYLKSDIGGEVTDERVRKVILAFFNWLKTKDWAAKVQNLETLKRKFPIFKASVEMRKGAHAVQGQARAIEQVASPV